MNSQLLEYPMIFEELLLPITRPELNFQESYGQTVYFNIVVKFLGQVCDPETWKYSGVCACVLEMLGQLLRNCLFF